MGVDGHAVVGEPLAIPRPPHRPFLLGCLAGAVLTALAVFGTEFVQAVRRALNRENEGQALVRVANDLCDYVEDHPSRWPGGWDDFDRERRRRRPDTTAATAFDHATVAVDWSADPTRLAAADVKQPPQVVWLLRTAADGVTFYKPNQTIADFLRSFPTTRSGTASGEPAPSALSPHG